MPMPRSYLRFMFNYSVLGQSFGKSWMILMCSWGCELLIQDNQGEHISLASDWLWKKHVPQSMGYGSFWERASSLTKKWDTGRNFLSSSVGHCHGWIWHLNLPQLSWVMSGAELAQRPNSHAEDGRGKDRNNLGRWR